MLNSHDLKPPMAVNEPLSSVDVLTKSELDPSETDPGVLWAEIWRLHWQLAGPDGYATWQDAAVAERRSRIAAQQEAIALKERAARSHIDRMRDVNAAWNALPKLVRAHPGIKALYRAAGGVP